MDESLRRKFQSIIGALWWLTSISRPDIYYAVHRCAKMQNKPNKTLGKCLDKILQYLASTKNLGLVYQRHPADTPVLSGYADASFASEPQSLSRVGYFYLFKGNLVSWCSENISRVVTSSTEAECRGLVQFTKENIWHRKFHSELKMFSLSTPTIVYEDNMSSISLSKNLGVPHKRSKHFDIEFNFFKQSVDWKEVVPIFVATEEQAADMLTKTIPATQFVYLREKVMGSQQMQDLFNV